MTTPVHADPRRSAAAGLGFEPASSAGSALEMPVLFQLSDLSQPKVLFPPSHSKPEGRPADASDNRRSEQTPSTAAAEIKPAHETEAPPASPGEVAPASAEKPLLASTVAAAESTSPVPADSPTIRQRAQLREKRRQAAVHGDWFQTQGKYILVVFLVLLVGVIYVARRGGDDSPPPPQLDVDLAVDADQPFSPAEEISDDAPQLADTPVSAPQGDGLYSADVAATPEETNPAEFAANEMVAYPDEQSPAAQSAPQVTLQAPVQGEPMPHPAADGGLFPWADQPEPRVATRVPQAQSQGSSAMMPQANPHFQSRPHAPGAASGVPIPEVYPSTGIEGVPFPQPTLPAEATPPSVYPVVDPPLGSTNPRGSSVQPSRRTEGPAVMAASYENRDFTATRTSGPRHERTGSGLY